MAYNPFDFFRKNQKVFFGVLTVLVMFMFILSFGQGDFFSQFPEWIGKWQKTGDVVAKVDGGNVQESELGDLSAKRRTASTFLLQAEQAALESLGRKADGSLKGPVSERFKAMYGRLPPDLAGMNAYVAELGRVEESKDASADDKGAARDLRRLAELVRASVLRKDPGEKPDNALFFNTQPDHTPRDRLEFLLWLKKAEQMGVKYTHADVLKLVDAELGGVLGTDLVRLAKSQSGKRESEVLDAVADEFRVRAAQEAVMGVGVVRDPGLTPPGTTQARLEHFLNETKVTKFTTVAVPVDAFLPLVTSEPTKAELDKIFAAAAGIDPDPSNPNAGIRDPRKVQLKWLELTGREGYYETKATERVAAERAAVVVAGSDPGRALMGGAAGFDYPAVGGYDQYATEQRRLLGYRASGEANPGPREMSNRAEGQVEGMAGLLGGPAGVPRREKLAADFTSYLQSPAADPQDKLLDAEVLRPEILASLYGLTVGGAATLDSPFAPAVMVTEVGYRQARKRGVIGGIQGFRLAPMPGLGALGEAVGVAAALHGEGGLFMDEKQALTGFEPKHPDPANPNDWTRHPGPAKPLGAGVRAVREFIERRTAEQLRGKIATEDVTAFAKEMARLGGEVEKAAKEQPTGTGDARKKSEADLKAKVEAARKAADDYAAKFAADRGLTVGGTTEPRNALTLPFDPGLAPLLKREARLLDITTRPVNERARMALAQPFLLDATGREDRGVYAVRQYAPPPRSDDQFYAPSAAPQLAVNPAETSPLTLVWRTTDEDAVRPFASDPKAVEACKAIWKRNKARDLARKAVDAAAARIQQAGKDEVSADKAVAEAVGQLRDGLPDSAAKTGLTRLADRGGGLTDDRGYFDVAKLPLVTPRFDPAGTPTIGDFDPHHPAILFESDKMREELLAHQDKPVGTAFVFADRPEATLYLTTVAAHQSLPPGAFREFILYPDADKVERANAAVVDWQRQAQSMARQFPQASPQLIQRIVGPPPPTPLSPRVLAGRFAAAARTAARTQAISLLKAEFNYTETDAGKKKLAEKGE